jgi:hypothetical protein
LFFEIGKIGKQLLNSAACRQRFHAHSNGHTQATDAWLTITSGSMVIRWKGCTC